jgi:hypothetical protein
LLNACGLGQSCASFKGLRVFRIVLLDLFAGNLQDCPTPGRLLLRVCLVYSACFVLMNVSIAKGAYSLGGLNLAVSDLFIKFHILCFNRNAT